MSQSTGDHAGSPRLCPKWVVRVLAFLINILNKHRGLITESTGIYAQFHSISRTRDQDEGVNWVSCWWAPPILVTARMLLQSPGASRNDEAQM